MSNSNDDICKYSIIILISFILTYYICISCNSTENFEQYSIKGKRLNDEQLINEKNLFVDEMKAKCPQIISEKNIIDNIVEKKCKEPGINNKTNCYNFLETKISIDNDTENICRVANVTDFKLNDKKIILRDTFFDNTHLTGYQDK
jgi:hypothetical protein